MKEISESENDDTKKTPEENLPESSQEPMETEEKDKSEEKTEEEKSDKTEKDQPETKESEPIPTHLFRVGWSLLDTGLQLGEDNFSYGYESSGRFVVNKQFDNYGRKFGVGDVIASFLVSSIVL